MIFNSPDRVAALTPLNTYERFPDGRPRVPYVFGVRADGGVNDATLRPAAESSMRVIRRLCRVSSLLALVTHQMAALRYDAAWAWKNSHAIWLARNCLS